MTRNLGIHYLAFGVFVIALLVAYICGLAFASGAGMAAALGLFLFTICLLSLLFLRCDDRRAR